jgi:hypothetical protein
VDVNTPSCQLRLFCFASLIALFSCALLLQTKRIKAQYDKEAEQLHRRYEALLTEEHQLFSEKQKMLQHDIAKMDLYLQSMHGSSTTPSQGTQNFCTFT